jgi:Asp-tRNA(Asn)/Glu-tRNA(Gln) amidotransferase A subunit family amidase
MYNNLSISELLRLHKAGELDLIAWNKHFIDRVNANESTIHAWQYVNEDHWLKNVDEAIANANPAFADLLGVPVGIKDIFNTIDMPTEMGSSIWKGFTPGNDARVVHNIKFHGGLSAGKTVTAEFAVHTPNETRNPWNTACSPGTSSSGSAAAVAAGMVPLAIGTQTAGSIIRPASYCGVFGFKPTFGTLPRTGMLKTTDTLDTVGLFGTNTDDCRRLFDVMRVKGLDYPYVNNRLENPSFQQKNGAKWKVGIVLEQHSVAAGYTDFALKAFADFVMKLNSLTDVEVVSPSFSSLFEQAHSVQETIYHKALSYYFKHEFEKKTLMSEVMYEIVAEGNTISPEAYHAAIANQRELTAEMDSLFQDVDVLITLSTAGHAPEFGIAIDPPDTCLIWTMCGLPTLSIPQFQHNGLPFGVQAIGRKYADYKLLDFVAFLTEKGLTPQFAALSN